MSRMGPRPSIPYEGDPMKKALTLCLAVLLALALPSCIKIPQEEVTTSGMPQGTPPPATTAATTAPFDPPPTVDFSDPDLVSQAFFGSTAEAIVDVTRREYSYTEMEADLQALASAHPTRLSYRSFGKSVAGRDLYVAILGNPNAQKQVLVSAGLHGREYLTPLLVMKQLEFYLTYYDVGSYKGIPYSTLFDSICFYVIPMNNPDGIMLSQSGISSITDLDLRNKIYNVYYSDFSAGLTSQTTIDSYLQYWKANANGVDLNRNFDALWEEYFNYSKPSFAQYKGPTPASEPETRATVELIESLGNPLAVLCIHSQGEVLYWNCGQESTLSQKTYAFTHAVSESNGYRIVEEKNNDASLSDWCALKKGLIAITVETGLGMCPLDLDKLPSIWQDNYDLLAMTATYFYR